VIAIRNARTALGLPIAALLVACGGAAAPAGTSPTPDAAPSAAQPGAAAIAAELRRATMPSAPRQVQFAWELDEAGARFRGRGVARYRAPDRFRLDLFGPRGETYLAAALVDETPRVPAALEQRFRLPSVGLLWGVVGVVRPPADARLIDAATTRETLVRYDLGAEGTLEYRARGGLLQSVRRIRSGGVQESIDLERGSDGALRTARYRDWVAFRTLNLTLESSNDVAFFPEDIWSPPGAAR
jgi:hypothetical protein